MPFQIKHKQSGKCLDWWVESESADVAIYDCLDKDDQTWVYYPQNGAVISAFENGKHNCLEASMG